MVSLTLPYPPSLNHYLYHVGAGRVMTVEARQYKERVGWQARAIGQSPLLCPVTVTLRVYRPAKRGDLDNTLKVVLDALNGILYADDKQIVEIHAYRYDDKQRPRVEITVEAAKEIKETP